MDLGVRDKVAVITGGSIGIGLAVAKGLAAEGAHVVIAARTSDRLDAACAGIAGTAKVRAVAGPFDVSTDEGGAAVVAAAEKEFGGADILANTPATRTTKTITN